MISIYIYIERERESGGQKYCHLTSLAFSSVQFYSTLFDPQGAVPLLWADENTMLRQRYEHVGKKRDSIPWQLSYISGQDCLLVG